MENELVELEERFIISIITEVGSAILFERSSLVSDRGSLYIMEYTVESTAYHEESPSENLQVKN